MTSHPGRLPNFLVIGAARCGTTAIAHHLRKHPQIYLPGRKELHYFTDNHPLGLNWYRDQFSGAQSEPIVAEATPAYMYDADAIARMAQTVPDARLLVMLRNPVDCAYSHYWMNRASGREPLTFEEAIAIEPKRLTGEVPVRGRLRRWAYVDRGHYVGQLRRVCEHFPRENLRVFLFEECIRHPAGQHEMYRDIYQFLGVDSSVPGPDPSEVINRPLGFRSVTLKRVTHRLPDGLQILDRIVGRFNQRPVKYPPLSAATRARLEEVYRASNEELRTWLGRELSAWNGARSRG